MNRLFLHSRAPAAVSHRMETWVAQEDVLSECRIEGRCSFVRMVIKISHVSWYIDGHTSTWAYGFGSKQSIN
jgi:hypothetical protein